MDHKPKEKRYFSKVGVRILSNFRKIRGNIFLIEY